MNPDQMIKRNHRIALCKFLQEWIDRECFICTPSSGLIRRGFTCTAVETAFSYGLLPLTTPVLAVQDVIMQHVQMMIGHGCCAVDVAGNTPVRRELVRRLIQHWSVEDEV